MLIAANGSGKLNETYFKRQALSRGNILLEICTPDIRISRISAGYQKYNKRISREN